MRTLEIAFDGDINLTPLANVIACSGLALHYSYSSTFVHTKTMAIELLPLPLPASADASQFQDFGREVKGLHPGKLTPEQFEEIKSALYHVRHVHLDISMCNLSPINS